MRATALISLLAVLALLAVAAGCTAPSAGGPTPAPSPAVTAGLTAAATLTGTTATTGTTAVTTRATTAAPAGPGIPLTAESARIASPGGTANVTIVLDSAPNGLSGYRLTVAVADPAVAEITAVAYPDWAGLKTDPSLPASRIDLSAVDLSQQVPVGAGAVTLATLTVRAKAVGSTAITLTPDPVLGVQDRAGALYTIAAAPGSLTVGA